MSTLKRTYNFELIAAAFLSFLILYIFLLELFKMCIYRFIVIERVSAFVQQPYVQFPSIFALV